MERKFLAVYSLYGKVLLAAALLAGACTFAIMWVIDANALTRKAFNVPVPAALEMTQSLLVFAIMLPFAYTLLKRDHVNTLIFTSLISDNANRWLYFFWMVVGCALFAAVAYGTYQYGLRSYRMNEQIWGATIQFPLWPSKMAVSVGALLLCIQFLLEAVGTVLIKDFHRPHTGQAEDVLHV